MASGTLYTYPENFRAYKVLIAAQYSGATVKVDSDFVFGVTNQSEAFLKKFPLGKVPAFESSDKSVLLTESNAIAYYVANKQLRGSDKPTSAALIHQWLSFADSEILPASCAVVFPVLGVVQYIPKNVYNGKRDLQRALTALNSHLVKNTYLVGNRITLADISLACTLLLAYQNVLDPKWRESYSSVNRWFNTIINQPQVKAVIGDVKLCDKPAEYRSASAADKGAKPEKTQNATPKAPAPAPAPAPAAGDNEEDLLAEEPKSKDPLDDLPKGTWVIDDFKRFYSNNDEDKSIPYFWEKFDPAHYSIWYGEYKYADELAKVFMSCNLITGMFQRLDKFRKNAFASVCLFGTDNDSSISGIWVWRGQDLAFKLSPDWQVDYETYAWEKLDPSSAATKDLVKQYFSWTGTDKKGRKFNQGKIFK